MRCTCPDNARQDQNVVCHANSLANANGYISNGRTTTRMTFRSVFFSFTFNGRHWYPATAYPVQPSRRWREKWSYIHHHLKLVLSHYYLLSLTLKSLLFDSWTKFYSLKAANLLLPLLIIYFVLVFLRVGSLIVSLNLTERQFPWLYRCQSGLKVWFLCLSFETAKRVNFFVDKVKTGGLNQSFVSFAKPYISHETPKRQSMMSSI
jgi:hypothetical protein